MNTLEIIGIILVVSGIIYIILRGLGKLSDESAEIETKIIKLKGGTGLILIVLGMTLLALGGGLPFLGDLSKTSEQPPVQMQETPQIPTFTETPIKTPSPASQPIIQPSPVMQGQKITKGYLIGTWSSIQGAVTETIAFYPDGSFYLQDYNLNTGENLIVTGVYSVSDSELNLITDTTSTRNSLSYIDQNTIKIDAYTYARIG